MQVNNYYNFDGEYAPLDVSTLEMAAQQVMTDLGWLDTLQQHLTGYLADRVKAQEIEVFRFCLHHIFLCIDTLHRLDLSEITTAHKTSGLTTYHRDWQQLVSLMGNIERIESLCQLLQGALLSLLDGLDTAPHTATLASCAGSNGTDTIAEQHELSQVAHEQWNMAYTALADRFEHWQLCSIRHMSFLDRFAQFMQFIPTLPQMDSALAELLEHGIAIFGDILLDFQAVSTGDEEAAATLLLDIAQKADQIIICTDTLLEVLPMLVQYHAPGIGMS